MRCLTLRWSCSIRLFRYFDERSFAFASNEPSDLGSRTAHETHHSRPAWRGTLLALHRFAEERFGGGYVTPSAQPEVDCPT
jgi:hypothetical protein